MRIELECGWDPKVLSPSEKLTELLPRVPRSSQLSSSAEGACLVRADLDVPIKDGVVTDAARLESLGETILRLRGRGQVPVLLGHIGRKPENSSLPLVEPLRQLYSSEIVHVGEWFADGQFEEPSDELVAAIQRAQQSGGMVLLENTRKYPFETALWDTLPSELDTQSLSLLFRPAKALASVAESYISDCISSSNPDWSSLVLPFFTDESSLADGVADEIEGNVLSCAESSVLIFSGLKPDKLNDLERIASNGKLRAVLIGGALAFPFLAVRGAMELDESDPRLNSMRVSQANRILETLGSQGAEILLPIDFVREDGSFTSLPHGTRDALDIGPSSVSEFKKTMRRLASGSSTPTVYMNGVFGVIEDSRFQAGTRSILDSLRDMTARGSTTYVGGGDCAAALRQFGDESWVSHVFTAGGTVLKAMSGRPLSFVSALALAGDRRDA